jgi:hypothetical protein
MRIGVARIDRQFARMEKKKAFLLDLIRDLPPEKYIWQPVPGSWCIGQVANHLYLSEKYSLMYLKKKLSYPDAIPSFHPRSWAGMLLYKAVLASAIKVRAPQTINMWEGQEMMDLAELENKWTALRREMMSLIREQYPAFKNHLVYKHPFAGRLTFFQMLHFFGDHIAHHTRQAKRILRAMR